MNRQHTDDEILQEVLEDEWHTYIQQKDADEKQQKIIQSFVTKFCRTGRC